MKIFSWDGDGPWGKPQKPVKKTSSRKSGPDPVFGPDDMGMDFEELVQQLRSLFGGGKGGGSANGGGFPLQYILPVLLCAWLASGIYHVDAGEAGIVTRFGAYVRTTEPGLHWHLPLPIEQVNKPRVDRENQVEVGFESIGTRSFFADNARGSNMNIRDRLEESLMLTGDENIVDLDFTVRWEIGAPQDYLFNVRHVDETIKGVAESVMREVIGSRPIDDALTSSKGEIEQAAKAQIQEIMDAYRAGVDINGVELQQVNPPTQVIDAFRDVQAARADEEKAVNEAEGYANDILPRARGQAAQIMEEAAAYKQSVVAKAQGEADRFNAKLVEYRKAPEVTRSRLYLETMQDVVGQAEKIVLPDGAAKQALPFLPLKPINKTEGSK